MTKGCISRHLLMASVLLLICIPAPAAELRGTWLARDSFLSRNALAEAMQTIAANNFNVVYVNVWSRGYPLWKSRVFERHTAILGDPGFGGRDILAEAVAEGHAAGLEVEAWFEYGFVGGWSGYYAGKSGKGPIFDRYPDWLARNRSGADAFPSDSGGNNYWMVHTRPEVAQFLIDLVTEVATQYDVDGVEFDRARYPSIDCGYDDYTRSLYRSEKNEEVPSNPNDSGWMRWRADKLNLFVASLYRNLKRLRPDVTVGNAPIVYPYGYVNFLQDYPAWLRLNALDVATPQVYRDTNAAYAAELDNQISAVNSDARLYPGIKTNGVPAAEVVSMVRTARNRGRGGVVHWYYGSLGASFAALKSQVYAEKAGLPYRPRDWNRAVLILDETEAGAQATGSWNPQAGGWKNNSAAASSGPPATVTYSFAVPRTGWYQAYAYLSPAPANAKRARYRLNGSDGSEALAEIDQSSAWNDRWTLLGTVYLTQGDRKGVISLSNEALAAGERVIADAVMLVQARLEPSSSTAAWQLEQNGSRIFPLAGGGDTRSGQILIEAPQREAPPGMAVFYAFARDGSRLVLVSSAGVPAVPPSRKAALFAEIGGSANSGVAISNPGDSRAQLSFTLRDREGKTVGSPSTLLLEPKQQFAKFVNQLIENAPAELVGSLWIDSDTAVGYVTLRGSINSRNEFLLTTMPRRDIERPAPAGPLILPQLADGGGYTTQLWLLNPSEKRLTGAVSLLAPNGSPLPLRFGGVSRSSCEYSIPPGGLAQWSSAGEESSLRTGYAVIIPGEGQEPPLASCVFSFVQASRTLTEVGVPASGIQKSARFYLRRSVSGEKIWEPGLAVANPGLQPANLRLTLHAPDGLRILGQGALPLAAGRQRSALLNEWLPSLPAEIEGVLVLESDVPVASLALQGITNQRSDYILSAVASADPESSGPLRILPHIAMGGEYSTEVIILSGSEQSVRGTIRIFLADGQPWFFPLF